jgi:hypothetical protein
MSSAIYLKFKEPITLSDWEAFCTSREIEYSPATVGGNVFYRRDVEIHFGDPSYKTYIPPFRPPREAKEICVSTFWMGDLEAVTKAARAILERWTGIWGADPELEKSMAHESAQK